MAGPFNGVSVPDLGGVVLGPFATLFVADQGADVLKIEPFGGASPAAAGPSSTGPASFARSSSPRTKSVANNVVGVT